MPRKKRPSRTKQEPAAQRQSSKSNDGIVTADREFSDQNAFTSARPTDKDNVLETGSDIATTQLNARPEASSTTNTAKEVPMAGKRLEDSAFAGVHGTDPGQHPSLADSNSGLFQHEDPVGTAVQSLPIPEVGRSWRTSAGSHLFWFGCFAGILGLNGFWAGKSEPSPQESIEAPEAETSKPSTLLEEREKGVVETTNGLANGGVARSVEDKPVGDEVDGQLNENRAKAVHRSEVKAKHRVTPEYPLAARQMGLEGTCQVRFFIDEKGAPYDIQIEKCPKVFEQTSEKAAWGWRFHPMRENGTAMRAQFILSLSFKLN